MGKRRDKEMENNGSFNPQDIGIEKRFAKKKKQEASQINANSMFAPVTTSVYHSHVPTSASCLAPIANGGLSAMQEKETVGGNQLAGYIFMCNGKTKPDCFKYRVFGLPAARIDVVAKIKPSTILFLFDFNLKILYGVFVAASNGILGLEPRAFGGKFSAQVRFEIFKDCLPLPEIAFKHVIKDNYQGHCKFRQELSNKQVNDLIPLFRTVAARQPAPVAPLIPNTVPPTRTLPPGFDEQRTLPPGFEEHVQPHQILHSSNDQSVAGLQFTPAGLAPAVQHGQQAVTPLAYEPHGSAAPEACFQPSVQSQHFLCAVQQPYSNPYYLEEGHQSYFPENPSLSPHAPCNRYAAVQENSESEIVPQLGTGYNHYFQNFGVTNAPVQHEALAASNAPIQAHAPTLEPFMTHSHIGSSSSSSSLSSSYWVGVASEYPNQAMATYWAGVASEDPNQATAAYWAGEASEDLSQTTAAYWTGAPP